MAIILIWMENGPAQNQSIYKLVVLDLDPERDGLPKLIYIEKKIKILKM